jgi:diguanylate cyclase (GGDEF)-like protein
MPLSSSSRAPAALLALLGLVEVEEQERGFVVRLAQTAAAWPFALAAQLLAALSVIVAMAIATGRLFDAPLLVAAAVPLAGSATWLLLALPAAVRTPAHHRVRAVTVAAAVTAGLLLTLLWAGATLPDRGIAIACCVVLAGAMTVTALVLHAVRAATLGFAAGLVVTLPLLAGFGIAAAAGLACFTCLAVAVLRLARLDDNAAAVTAAAESEGRLAAKMLAEFETQGTAWFWEADRQGRLTYLSTRVADVLAAGGTSPVGRPLTEVFRMDSAVPGNERTLAFHLSSRTSFSDYSVRAANVTPGQEETERCWSISGRPVMDDMGRFQGFIGSGTDLTERRRSEAEITRLALFDGLTGLANRQRMRLSLDKTLHQQAGPYRPTALFLMDLDRFKAVNDTLGHQAGDALLKQVAQRLTRGVGDAGLVGRLGGDEFQVLLPGIDNRDALSQLARDLIRSLSEPYFVAGASVTIGCSIGIVVAATRGEEAETLIRNADLALYAAKADGRGVHRFYSDEMLAGAQAAKQLEDDLRQAIASGGFHLAYQPVVSTTDQRITGFEALIRWDHPTRGRISPSDFIPVAEDCGLIAAIGEWVLRTACHEAASWPGGTRVAVNVSPIQFANPQLPAIVASALASAGLPPQRLELEITEGVFLDDSTSSDQMFKALKGLGVRLALDDFGTGYSSLGYLRSAPFDKIKIDQSFVKGAAQPGNRNAAIIKAIVTLAQTLGMETTAEGVEVQDEIDLVADLGVSHIQGYVYGRPMLGEEARAQLAAAGAPATPSGYRVSRSPRTKMLRSARIQVGQAQGAVRIRDISATGAMIDGIDVGGGGAVGLDVLIELVEDQMYAAKVRWAEGGRAGLEFAEQINLDRLQSAPPHRPARRAV